MRTNRERLTEWMEDIQRNMGEDEFYRLTPEEWADRIYEDINRGIISPEKTDPVDEDGRRTGKASFYGDK